MSNVASSSSISVNVDFEVVFHRIGSDFVLFAAAVLAYWVLRLVKYKGKAVKSPCEEAFSESEQESYTKDVDATFHIPVQLAPKVILNPKVPAIESKQFQNKHQPDVQHPEHQPEVYQPEVHQPKQQPFDVPTHLALMQKHAAAKDIKGTLDEFHLIQRSGESLTSPMYNTVMRAWIKCGNVWAAENWMDKIKEGGMADENSFVILMKALVMVRDLDKASALLDDMREVGLPPSSAIFDELLIGLARGGLFNDGISLLQGIDVASVQPTSFTLHMIAELVNNARKINHSCSSMRQIVLKFDLLPNLAKSTNQKLQHDTSQLPLLAVVALQKDASASVVPCVHDVEIKGSLSRMKAVRKTLKQHGFLDKSETDSWPLDGHWQTTHGLVVVIERKIVRWSQQRASRLCFTSSDRRECALVVYGESTRGHLAQPIASGAPRALKWDNGDVWHSYGGRVICQTTLFSQSMTKILRDRLQDRAYRERTAAVLKCVSRQGLHMLSTILESTLLQYLGNDLYFLRVHFESSTIRADVFNTISCRHPRVGFRHCWVKPSTGPLGQQTIVNGDLTDEASFNRHINAVSIARQ